MKLKSDRYRTARGGWSRFLDISCAKCGSPLLIYQKDGPGPLKRLYVDRIVKPEKLARWSKLMCAHCKELLGIPYTYQKEQRKAIRVFQNALSKKMMKNR